ncbi:type II toxin-antitoxin system RelE/ParE family toxin [Pusillimonas sp. ANT_WB101]|uniref:type II toxin-antitoxin system RelE/ParE family toxin n=1 Tax=Pusillimonas sp. ANT_WB101 TaxID=2597356 RepID=UPI0011EC60D9|nr:type II toxin-antitoxin system RelE/ParE family toxin [Pusillimonas sp. ANT_WB101]
MSTYTVVFTPEAQQQLQALYRYIALQGAPLTAQRYTDAIVSTCERLASFPMCGVAREDIRPGLRLTHHKKRTIIAFTVNDKVVTILGILYGGQNITAAFDSDESATKPVRDLAEPTPDNGSYLPPHKKSQAEDNLI